VIVRQQLRRLRSLRQAEFLRFSLRFSAGLRLPHFAELRPTHHHGQDRRVVRVQVAPLQRLGVLPPAGRCEVGQAKMLPRPRPAAAVGVPCASLLQRELARPLRLAEPFAREILRNRPRRSIGLGTTYPEVRRRSSRIRMSAARTLGTWEPSFPGPSHPCLLASGWHRVAPRRSR
jgi:hypothetical protein